MFTAASAGGATGAALAGRLVDVSGPATAAVVAAVVGVLGGVVASLGHRPLSLATESTAESVPA